MRPRALSLGSGKLDMFFGAHRGDGSGSNTPNSTPRAFPDDVELDELQLSPQQRRHMLWRQYVYHNLNGASSIEPLNRG